MGRGMATATNTERVWWVHAAVGPFLMRITG
jgi:hypothetical protein